MVGISKCMKIINLQIGELNKLTRNMIKKKKAMPKSVTIKSLETRDKNGIIKTIRRKNT